MLQHNGCLKDNFLLQVTLTATLLKAEFDSDKIPYLTVVLPVWHPGKQQQKNPKIEELTNKSRGARISQPHV